MHQILIYTFLCLPLAAQAKTILKNDWVLTQSHLEYTVNFPLKTITGANHDSKGKVQCGKTNCEFIVATEMKKFDSGDSNRDLHMQEATKASVHPIVSVHGFLPTTLDSQKFTTDLDVEFAGVKKVYKNVTFQFSEQNGEIDVSSKIVISLKEHKVKAPSLLGVAIDDEVPLKISTHWKSL